jgi:hypothetical protein
MEIDLRMGLDDVGHCERCVRGGQRLGHFRKARSINVPEATCSSRPDSYPLLRPIRSPLIREHLESYLSVISIVCIRQGHRTGGPVQYARVAVYKEIVSKSGVAERT